jgi:hypothetical protein
MLSNRSLSRWHIAGFFAVMMMLAFVVGKASAQPPDPCDAPPDPCVMFDPF